MDGNAKHKVEMAKKLVHMIFFRNPSNHIKSQGLHVPKKSKKTAPWVGVGSDPPRFQPVFFTAFRLSNRQR